VGESTNESGRTHETSVGWGDGESICKRDSVVPIARNRWPSICAVYPRSSRLPGWTSRPSPLLDLAPSGVYRAVRVASHAGALLPHRFTLTWSGYPAIGGLLSVALSV